MYNIYDHINSMVLEVGQSSMQASICSNKHDLN